MARSTIPIRNTPSQTIFNIGTPINIYVDSTYGDDNTNSGLSLVAPFRSLSKAFSYLRDKYITEQGFVTINLSEGTHTIDSDLRFSHPNGDRIALSGVATNSYNLKQVTSYSDSTISQSGAVGHTHDIGIVVVNPITLSTEHGYDGTTGSIRLVLRDSTIANNTSTVNRRKFANYTAAKLTAIVGSHKIKSYTSATMTLSSDVKNLPFVQRLSNNLVGATVGYHSIGGNGTNNLDTWTGTILNASPVGQYGNLESVGAGANTTAFTSYPEGYLYNSLVPVSGQITDDTITATILKTIIDTSNGSLIIENSGLRSISNISFDGGTYDSFAQRLDPDNACLILKNSIIGRTQVNEPAGTLGGLENVSFADSPCGLYSENSTVIGNAPVATNCFVGFWADSNSTFEIPGIVTTGCDYAGVYSTNNSAIKARNSICGLAGYSVCQLMFDSGTETNSFIPGEFVMQIRPNGYAFGKVMDWDSTSSILTVSQANGFAENELTFGMTGDIVLDTVQGGTGQAGSCAYNNILHVSSSVLGHGFVASNNATIDAINSLAFFNKHSNFAAVRNSSLKINGSVSFGSKHGGVYAYQNSSIEANASMSAYADIGYRAEVNSLINANTSVAIANYTTNYYASTGSTINIVGYESRPGVENQIIAHTMSIDNSFINNISPKYVQTEIYSAGETQGIDLIVPTENYDKAYRITNT
jgi:hypothetical protein